LGGRATLLGDQRRKSLAPPARSCARPHPPRPLSEVFAEKGFAGLEELPPVRESIALSIRDLLVHGKLVMLDRLRGEHDTEVTTSVRFITTHGLSR